MKITTFFFALPFVAATCTTAPPAPSYTPAENNTVSVTGGCCCLSYKSACTMNTERMFHVKTFYNRKKGTTPEEFNSYWANNHTQLVKDFHLRLGVYKYSQYHSTPEYRDLLRVPGAAPVLEFDGAAEFWMPRLEIFAAMGSDPFYTGVIQPDEANFIDLESVRMIVGVDYIVVENQNEVLEHGQTF